MTSNTNKEANIYVGAFRRQIIICLRWGIQAYLKSLHHFIEDTVNDVERQGIIDTGYMCMYFYYVMKTTEG